MLSYLPLRGSWSLTATRVVMPFHRASRQYRDHLNAPCMGMNVSVRIGERWQVAVGRYGRRFYDDLVQSSAASSLQMDCQAPGNDVMGGMDTVHRECSTSPAPVLRHHGRPRTVPSCPDLFRASMTPCPPRLPSALPAIFRHGIREVAAGNGGRGGWTRERPGAQGGKRVAQAGRRS